MLQYKVDKKPAVRLKPAEPEIVLVRVRAACMKSLRLRGLAVDDSPDRLQLKEKYRGSTAFDYEARRRSDALWHREHRAIEAMLKHVQAAGASSVMDIPVGTGRFAPIYKGLGLKLIGLDISKDMLRQATAACDSHGVEALLEIGNAFAIAKPDNSVDVALCIRFMQHIDFLGFETVIAELKRVARTHVILGIHLVQNEQQRGFSRLLRAFSVSPVHTISRIWKGLLKSARIQRTQINTHSGYMTRTDKDEERVLAHLYSLGLSIIEDREILTSLRPGKAVSYRLLLLELSHS